MWPRLGLILPRHRPHPWPSPYQKSPGGPHAVSIVKIAAIVMLSPCGIGPQKGGRGLLGGKFCCLAIAPYPLLMTIVFWFIMFRGGGGLLLGNRAARRDLGASDGEG